MIYFASLLEHKLSYMQTFNSGKLNIIAAVYGLETVTTQIQSLVSKGKIDTLELLVENDVIGLDGWRGQIKSLTVVYNYDNGPLRVTGAKEHEVLKINPDTISSYNQTELTKPGQGHFVLAATYGPKDVTAKLRALSNENGTIFLTVSNAVFGDTWPGIAKTLVVVLGTENEVTNIEIFAEREKISIYPAELIAG